MPGFQKTTPVRYGDALFVKHKTDIFILYLSYILTVLQDVTAENFLAALKGDQSAVKKRGPKKVIARFV